MSHVVRRDGSPEALDEFIVQLARKLLTISVEAREHKEAKLVEFSAKLDKKIEEEKNQFELGQLMNCKKALGLYISKLIVHTYNGYVSTGYMT